MEEKNYKLPSIATLSPFSRIVLFSDEQLVFSLSPIKRDRKGKGQAMPKKKTFRRFALVEKEILYSKSWTKLTDSAKVVYLHLKGEFNGSNRDNLKLPYSQMRKIMSNATFWRGIKLLEKVGFIDIVTHGGLEKNPNVYKISERWRLNEKTLQEYQEEFKQKQERRLYWQTAEDYLTEDKAQNKT